MSPAMLQESINDLKADLEDKNAPFGVDLAVPQVGGNARKTNVGEINFCCTRSHAVPSTTTRMEIFTS